MGCQFIIAYLSISFCDEVIQQCSWNTVGSSLHLLYSDKPIEKFKKK